MYKGYTSSHEMSSFWVQLSLTLHPPSPHFKTAKHLIVHLIAAIMTCKNIMLKLATILPALSLSLALGAAQQQDLEPGQWHPALPSDGTQGIDVEP
jgi:hypothetical protein